MNSNQMELESIQIPMQSPVSAKSSKVKQVFNNILNYQEKPVQTQTQQSQLKNKIRFRNYAMSRNVDIPQKNQPQQQQIQYYLNDRQLISKKFIGPNSIEIEDDINVNQNKENEIDQAFVTPEKLQKRVSLKKERPLSLKEIIEQIHKRC